MLKLKLLLIQNLCFCYNFPLLKLAMGHRFQIPLILGKRIGCQMLILRQRNDDCIWRRSVNYKNCDLSLPLSSVVYIAIFRQTYQQLKVKKFTLHFADCNLLESSKHHDKPYASSTRKPQAPNLNLKKQPRVVQQSHKYQRSSGTKNLMSVTQTPSIDNTGVNPEISRIAVYKDGYKKCQHTIQAYFS